MKLSYKNVRAFVGLVLTLSMTTVPLAANAQYTGTNGQMYFQYIDSNGVTSLAAMNSDGTQAHIVVSGASGQDDYFGKVAINPAGTKIAFTHYMSQGGTITNNLYTANPDGSGVTSIYAAQVSGTTTNRIPLFPAFSSDGTKIYFGEGNALTQTDGGIYSIPTSGGSPTQLIADASNVQYENGGLAVTSSKLFFIKGDFTSGASFDVQSSSLTGTGITTVKHLTSYFSQLYDVSTDGAKLLLNEESNGNTNVFESMLVSNGAVTTLLSPTSAFFDGASFSPDGTKLVYSQETANSDNTYTNLGPQIINADGTGTPVVLRADAISSTWSAVPDAANGTYAALPTGTTTQQAQRGGGGGDETDANSATLPNTGTPLGRNLPYLLLGLGLAGVGAIEAVSRVRRAKQ